MDRRSEENGRLETTIWPENRGCWPGNDELPTVKGEVCRNQSGNSILLHGLAVLSDHFIYYVWRKNTKKVGHCAYRGSPRVLLDLTSRRLEYHGHRRGGGVPRPCGSRVHKQKSVIAPAWLKHITN